MEFSRQEHWSWLLFPTPGDLPDPGAEPVLLITSALAGIFFTTVPPAIGKLLFEPENQILVLIKLCSQPSAFPTVLFIPKSHFSLENWLVLKVPTLGL